MMSGMVELPTGTVTLLFSDVEGSTVLLSRLGAAYAEALDGQRLVLRKAWAEHGGVELGTEGDSFYVVFPTAPDAVTAAAQAQRELAVFQWPAGEQVRVRMGIHTGNPTAHDGAYVGMDVHRAARIAGSAHGGQVVISSSTAELVGGSQPDRVALRDLGSHQLKDIPQAEHLYQLVIDGLSSEFPPIKTLGAASSLPRPATPLVGRDGELAELTALMGSPDVRLVTLTGPGGTGKTRLAIALAQGMVERFPDGVYFVPLAAVTTADVMWTTIAEVLDVPPEGRIPPGFFDHVAHRTALFVLDNLEQIDGADDVVAELLEHGPQVVLIVTSRRPLNVSGELQHAVPPLELPEHGTLAAAERSGAVQMFVQHAKAVKASFNLTAANAADLVEVCQKLDGLPLAIELAAARTKLLSPAALLTRLDKALDIAATGSRAPSRQKTLRGAIAWSYELLDPPHQAFFRSLGVFAGGADLDAIGAVTADLLDGSDPLVMIADLVDASLAVITDDEAGEPRIGMLETIRAFALDQVRQAGEIDAVSKAHADHYLTVAEQLYSQLRAGGDQLLATRRRFELEHDNLRAALSWALGPDRPQETSPDRLTLGLRLSSNMGQLWDDGGYWAEALQWLERAVKAAGDQPNLELARCLTNLANVLMSQGELDRARDMATRSAGMYQRLGGHPRQVWALNAQGNCELELGNNRAARQAYEQALTIARSKDQRFEQALLSMNLAGVEAHEGNYERALELSQASIDAFTAVGDELSTLDSRLSRAYFLLRIGRLSQAEEQMRRHLPVFLRLAPPEYVVDAAETYASLLAATGNHEHAAQLLGAADATRERIGVPRFPRNEAELQEDLATARAALPKDRWDSEYQLGRNMTVEDALTEAYAATGHVDSDAELSL